ncbi:membrane bound O-acyl transferase family-domain-containing protein [Boeremia exigua]|uniref:membrane bound O-acyl transferase family-domain-containing protein n=1 Tax=Boeremia exigua TaxID=749465 RepID=UPI001E8DACE2|nr:membrane bound O-acyl transferase family-domain-containing protein [Boeremia exigua]KAH6625509.1 membrane bound O-acyl transferase family-domain-containing protein [Boeremia exigua]
MERFLGYPTPLRAYGYFAAVQVLSTATLGFTRADSARSRIFLSIIILLLNFLGDRTIQAASDDLSVRLFFSGSCWIHALHITSLLVQSRLEYTIDGDKVIKNKSGAPESIFVSREPSGDGKFLSRLKWSLAMQWNFRRIKTSKPSKNIPPFSYTNPQYVPSRMRFCISRMFSIILSVGYLALVDPHLQPKFEDLAPSRVILFSRLKEITLLEVVRRVMATISWLGCVFASNEISYGALAIIFNILGLSEPVMWPSSFGPLRQSYSLRNWWGVTWHQTWRSFLSDHADLVLFRIMRLRKSTFSFYAKLFLAYFISGLLHLPPDMAAGVPLYESGAMGFLLVQVAGLIFEETMQKLNKKMGLITNSLMVKTIGYIWVAFWLTWTLPWLAFPRTRYRPLNFMLEPPDGHL